MLKVFRPVLRAMIHPDARRGILLGGDSLPDANDSVAREPEVDASGQTFAGEGVDNRRGRASDAIRDGVGQPESRRGSTGTSRFQRQPPSAPICSTASYSPTVSDSAAWSKLM